MKSNGNNFNSAKMIGKLTKININSPEVLFREDALLGDRILHKETCIGNLKTVFREKNIAEEMPADIMIYEVDVYQPLEPGTLGGLFFGITRILPGQVGDEYYMTKGHSHNIKDRSEFYWCIKGEGVLILKGPDGKVRAERMRDGSLHFIPGFTAHRVANTGDGTLSFGACWPADAGHDYASIEEHGFGARLLNINGSPALVAGD